MFGATAFLGMTTPTGFIPPEDRGSVFIDVRLPDGAALPRTTAVLGEVEKIERMTLEDLFKLESYEEEVKAFVRDNLGDEQAYLNRFKLNRIQLYLYNYTLLTRLRNDIDEAWDTVEELYGED